MTQLEIFDTIVGIMQEDSATKKDKKGANLTPFREQLLTDLPKEDFIYLIRTYLASFGVLGHIWYDSPATPRLGAFLRRHEDSLHVLDSDSRNGFEVGDCIVSILIRFIKSASIFCQSNSRTTIYGMGLFGKKSRAGSIYLELAR